MKVTDDLTIFNGDVALDIKITGRSLRSHDAEPEEIATAVQEAVDELYEMSGEL